VSEEGCRGESEERGGRKELRKGLAGLEKNESTFCAGKKRLKIGKNRSSNNLL